MERGWRDKVMAAYAERDAAIAAHRAAEKPKEGTPICKPGCVISRSPSPFWPSPAAVPPPASPSRSSASPVLPRLSTWNPPLPAHAGQVLTVSLRKTERTRPRLASAAVDGRALVLIYDEDLNFVTVPPADSFTARVNGRERALTGVAIEQVEDVKAVTLTLAEAVIAGDTVTVSYDRPRRSAIDIHRGHAVAPLQDLSGNEADNFTNRAVTNDSAACPTGQPANFWQACLTIGDRGALGFYDMPGDPRTRHGKLSDKTTDQGWRITSLRYSEGLFGLALTFENHSYATARSAVLQIGDTSFKLADATLVPNGTGYAWDPADLDWTAASVGDKVSVSLRDGDADVPPRALSARVNGATLVVAFDEALDTVSVPPASAFDVEVAARDRARWRRRTRWR